MRGNPRMTSDYNGDHGTTNKTVFIFFSSYEQQISLHWRKKKATTISFYVTINTLNSFSSSLFWQIDKILQFTLHCNSPSRGSFDFTRIKYGPSGFFLTTVYYSASSLSSWVDLSQVITSLLFPPLLICCFFCFTLLERFRHIIRCHFLNITSSSSCNIPHFRRSP